MQEGMQFRFELPRQPQGPVVEISLEEAEKTLLKKVEAEKSQPLDALWELACFYQQTRQFDKGLDCLRQILPKIPDAERKASCVLGFGQMMESIGDYKAAVGYYKEAMTLEPVRTTTWYFIKIEMKPRERHVMRRRRI